MNKKNKITKAQQRVLEIAGLVLNQRSVFFIKVSSKLKVKCF